MSPGCGQTIALTPGPRPGSAASSRAGRHLGEGVLGKEEPRLKGVQVHQLHRQAAISGRCW